MSLAADDKSRDPSLDAKLGFYKFIGSSEDKGQTMIVTADFQGFVRVNEVILKKRNHPEFKLDLIRGFRFEYKSKGKWVTHG